MKKLQGIAPETETVADRAATATTVDNAASDAGAAATELIHTTSNKTVAVPLPSPADQTSPAGEVTGTDEKAGAQTESVGDADATKPKSQTGAKAPTVRTGTSLNTQPKLVKDIKDAVKNVRNGFNGPSTRQSTESTSSSSSSSAGAYGSSTSGSARAGSDSPARKDADSKSKHDNKK
ncbi:hypothetical protein [Mycobacterium sp. NPDC004974]